MNVIGLFLISFLLFFYFLKKMWKKNILAAFFFIALYGYGIPGLVSYYYFPGLINPLTNFGEEYWLKYYVFILFSLLAFAFLTIYFFNHLHQESPLVVYKINQNKSIRINFALLLLLTLTFCQVFVMLNYYPLLSWENIANESFMNNYPIIKYNNIIFKQSVGINICLWAVLRKKLLSKRLISYLSFIFSINITVMVIYCTLTGNRTDILAVLLGILMIEVSLGYLNRKNIFKYFLFVVSVIAVMAVIEANRYTNVSNVQVPILQRVLRQDYSGPIQMLFVAIRYNIIEPLEVIYSNFYNSLILMGYPYLQYGLTELISPGLATRSSGFAFYVFTEGFLFMGFWGFIYNGVILGFWIYIWKRLSNTNDPEFNTVIMAVMAKNVVNLTRGQTSYFIKYLLGVMIATWIYLLLSGKDFKFIIRIRK